jgi:hypothetical protein
VLLAFLFTIKFVVAFALPFLGTIYAKENSKKWITYWVLLLSAEFFATPVFKFILSESSSAFLMIVIALALIFLLNN